MKFQTKQLLRAHVLDYLAKKVPNFKIEGRGGKRIFTCVEAHQHTNMDNSPSANFMDDYKVYCYAHRKCYGDIFEITKRLEPDKKKYTEDEIGKYLTELLELEVDWSSETDIKTSIQDDVNKLIKILISKSNNYIKNLKPDHIVKNYIKERGFTNEIIEEFQIGTLQLQQEDIDDHRYLLRKMKLITPDDRKMFGDNIIFPIYEYGKVKGFQLRNIDYEKTGKPKYIAYTVDGYDFYCKDINKDEPIYVVEGITDLIALHMQGIKNSVAILTSSSNKWYNLNPKKIVIVPDTDWAGMEGLERNIDNLLGKKEVHIRILEIPHEYKDVDEFTVKGQSLKDIEEKDVVHWSIEDFESRKVLAFKYIANRVTEIEKEQYIEFLHKKLEVSKEAIAKDLLLYDKNAMSLGKSDPNIQHKMESFIDNWYENTKTRSDEIIGLKSLPIFDSYFSGLQGGIYIFLAQAQHCKSLLCVNAVVKALEKNDNVLVVYYSIDDSSDMTLAKMVASRCRGKVSIPEIQNIKLIDNNEFLTLPEKNEKKNLIAEQVKWFKGKAGCFDLVWEETAFEKVRVHMIDVIQKYNDKKVIFVFDSFHNIMGKGQRDEKFFSEMATFLLNFSNTYNCPILCTCHTAMSVDNFDQMKGRTKYSGEIYYHARAEIDLKYDRLSEENGLLNCRVVKNKLTGIEGDFQLKIEHKKCYIKGDQG